MGNNFSCLITLIEIQAISARERALCQLCVLSFRVEVKKEKATKVVPCKWYSEVSC